ncbi:MAG TPA: hypothetical protein VD931_12045 [Baekduia sp.]|nr:hypothetical protein [Baekduia sp.]
MLTPHVKTVGTLPSAHPAGTSARTGAAGLRLVPPPARVPAQGASVRAA